MTTKTAAFLSMSMKAAKIILLCSVFAMLSLCSHAKEAAKDQATPLVTVTAGWTYLDADQGGGQRTNLNGWFARPAVNIAKGYAAFADFTNYYGLNKKGSINSHGYTFGVSKSIFSRPKIKPTVFAEIGDVRSSNAGTIVNQFAFATGASFAFPIRRWVSLAVTPAEWVLLYPHGLPRNDFNSKIGLSFPFGRR